MNSVLMAKVEESYLKKDIPAFNVGDSISVTYKIIEEKVSKKKSSTKSDKEDKERSQTFTGIVLSKQNSGIRSTFTVRKISHGVGVERIFVLHSPIITGIKIVKQSAVRRAKIFFMRERVGKLSMKTGKDIEMVVEGKDESEETPVVEETK
ncbi:MAG: 50S ribosomal protein L19 [bacterium]